MGQVYFYSFYSDLQLLDLVERIVEQRNRDAHLAHLLHELSSFFPVFYANCVALIASSMVLERLCKKKLDVLI